VLLLEERKGREGEEEVDVEVEVEVKVEKKRKEKKTFVVDWRPRPPSSISFLSFSRSALPRDSTFLFATERTRSCSPAPPG